MDNSEGETLFNPIPFYPTKEGREIEIETAAEEEEEEEEVIPSITRRRRRQRKQKKSEQKNQRDSSDSPSNEKGQDGLIARIMNHFYGKSPTAGASPAHQIPPAVSPSIRDENGGIMRVPLTMSQRRYMQRRQSLTSKIVPVPRPSSGLESSNASPSLSFLNNLFTQGKHSIFDYGSSSRDYLLSCISSLVSAVSTGVHNGVASVSNSYSKDVQQQQQQTIANKDSQVAGTENTGVSISPQSAISDSAENAIKDLARIIKSGCSVLFVTGAGVSVGSGVPTYRTGEDGIWNKYIYEWGTKEKFLSDPTTWWNDFWFKTHDIDQNRVLSPCAAHYAITDIMREFPNVNLVTQNVDRLHLKSGADPARVIEIHGALDVYRCSNRACKYATEKCIEGVTFEKSGDGKVVPPHCPACGAYIMPMTLLFDELYSSHSFFRKKTFQEWLDRADVVVFVGTSFSVNVTLEVLRVAALWDTEVFNFNVEPKRGYGIRNITGPSEVLLPELAKEVGITALSQRSSKGNALFYVLWVVVVGLLLVCMALVLLALKVV